MWSALLRDVTADRWRCSGWGAAVIALGASSALLAFLVGPILRVIFGGASLSWSPLLHAIWGAPPSLDRVKSLLPWLIASVALLKAISFYSERTLRGHIVRKTGRALRVRLMRWVLDLSEDERRALGQDEIRARLTVDVERVERWLELGSATLIRDGLQVMLLAVSAVMVSGWAGVIMISVYPILIAPIIWASRRLKRAARQEISSAHQLGRWSAYAEAHISRAQAQNQDQTLLRALAEQHRHLEHAQARLAHLQGVAPSFTELSVSWVIAGSLAGFMWGVERSWWSAEELMSLFVCILMLYAPVKSLGRAQQQWVTGRAALERISTPMIDSYDSTPHQVRMFGLRINGFQAVRGGALQSQPLSLTVRPGEVVGIAGANGVGKSSLLMALAGLVPARGELWIRDAQHAWREVKRAPHTLEGDARSLESRYDLGGVSWSAQPPRVFAHELQALAHQCATAPDSYAAQLLRSFALDLTSMRIPRFSQEGDLTEVMYWDWFQELSSGERQRLSLVMALTQPVDLILLDEPEAHLDDAGISALISNLKSIGTHRIVMIATHSAQLKRSCDQVITLR